jgi:hypothetical protein
MSEKIIVPDQTDEGLLTSDTSDEALEAAALSAGAAFTLGACTALSVCPD